VTSVLEPRAELRTSGQHSASEPSGPGSAIARLAVWMLLGAVFGLALEKSEAASWYRIQEMLRFEGPKLFLVLGSAVVTAAACFALLRREGARSLLGTTIELPPKTGLHRSWIGGTMFGLGWGLIGVCPGAMWALLGGGVPVILVGILAALVGTRTYAACRHRLPH
jgi:uncharacterized membrane protein YedE/YeeE